jgi:SHAQKYF class myb-like DNA-binding protein
MITGTMDEKKRAAPSTSPGGGDANNVAAATTTSPKKKKQKTRKIPMKWSESLHRDFVSAIFDIGVKHATPAVVLETMLVQDREVTADRVKSHLQKYRVHRDRSKTEFMAQYDQALERIKERGGTNWHPTDRFLGGDVAASMAYYSMNPDASMPMPIDLRMSAVAGPSNVPAPRDEYTEMTQGGDVYSDHRPASRRGSGNAGGSNGVPMSPAPMHPVVSTGALKTDLDESSRINFPSLTGEETKSAMGRKLRKLADDYNSTINHLLEGRKSIEGGRRGGSQHTPQDSRDSIGSHRRISNESPHVSHSAAASTSMHHYDASMYDQGHYMQYPIHPQGYVPPDGAQTSSSPPHHHYPGYDYYSQATSAPATAHHQDDASTKTSSFALEDSKATPLYESQRFGGDSYGMPSSGGRGRGRSSGTHNTYYNSNDGPAPSPPHYNQNWSNGYSTSNNHDNHNGYSSYNYENSHHSQPHHHYDNHRGDMNTKSNRGTSYAPAHTGQSSGQSSAPQHLADDHSEQKAKSGSIDSSFWDEVDVEFSPIAH